MKKRILAVLAALTLCLSTGVTAMAADSPSAGDVKVKLDKPTNLSWGENWDTSWGVVPEAHGHYDFVIYKDGQEYYSTRWSMGDYYTDIFEANTSREFNESGSYVFKVRASNAYAPETLEESDWATSVEKVYTRPDKELGTTVGYWDAEKAGLFHYKTVEGAGGYYIQLYKKEAGGKDRFVTGTWWARPGDSDKGGEDREFDFTARITETGQYYVTVTALSGQIDVIANGVEGEKSPLLNTGVIVDNIDDILDNMDTSNPEAVKDQLKDTSLEDLRIAMQTDDKIIDKMKELESAYVNEKNITVKQEVSAEAEKYVESSKISMVGAGLNADGGEVKLAVSVPDKKVTLPENNYADSVQLDLKLMNDGQSKGKLDIPISITMPIPAGVNPGHFDILHYHADGTHEVLRAKENGDGTVTFTVTSFSTFAFANKMEDTTTPSEPTKPADPTEPAKPAAPAGHGSLDNRVVTQNVTAEGVVVRQKTLQQGDLNDVQKNILGATFTAFANIDNDTTLTEAQKNEKKAAAVQSLMNAALGVNYNYKSDVYAWLDVVSTPGKEIPLEVAGVKAGDNVVIAHLTTDGTWENVKATRVENGKVYAIFNSFSPVLVAVTGSSVTSPKTADTTGAGIVVAMVAAAGVVVCMKKRK